jgi:hypothetical protein
MGNASDADVATLTAALGIVADEVQGFETKPPVAQQALMGQILTNLTSMQHEVMKSIANNLRA